MEDRKPFDFRDQAAVSLLAKKWASKKETLPYTHTGRSKTKLQMLEQAFRNKLANMYNKPANTPWSNCEIDGLINRLTFSETKVPVDNGSKLSKHVDPVSGETHGGWFYFVMVKNKDCDNKTLRSLSKQWTLLDNDQKVEYHNLRYNGK